MLAENYVRAGELQIALRSAETLTPELVDEVVTGLEQLKQESPGEGLNPLTEEIMQLRHDLQIARGETAAFLMALATLEERPDMPGIHYMVKEPGSKPPVDRIIPGRQVQGWYQALYKLAASLMPTAAAMGIASEEHGRALADLEALTEPSDCGCQMVLEGGKTTLKPCAAHNLGAPA